MCKTLCRGLAVAVSMAAFLFLSVACAEEAAGPPPAPPSPTPVLSDLLTGVGEMVAVLSSAKVRMVDETESGAPFFTMTLKSMEAEIKAPDRFRMIVNAESNAFGFSELEMLAVGDEAVMKFAKDAPWGHPAPRPRALQLRRTRPDSARFAIRDQGRRRTNHRQRDRNGVPDHSCQGGLSSQSSCLTSSPRWTRVMK